ncbi:hypothetical protein F5B20DRAFT_357654 [Whalleya microplaca]|nr:hypothetical protein F5B20DRAFT_357654 [Whalleya microplaca]
MADMESIRFPQAPDYEPTVDVPLVTAEMRAMLKILYEGNMYDLGLHVLDRAEDRYRRSTTGELRELASMKQLVEDNAAAKTWVEIIHSMPKELVRAIVLKTTAAQAGLDKHDAAYLRRDIYHRDGPGTYVAVIAVINRKGRWLTGTELRRLIERLERYLEAEQSYRALPRGANGAVTEPTTQEAIELGEYVARIDGHYAKARYPKPMFIENDEQKRVKVERLIAALRRFLCGARDDVPLAQAPDYVGCSRTLVADSTENHMTRTGWHADKRNHTYWLVLSCMKDMGLVPEVVTTRAAMTWMEGQLHLSETLVTMLAGSLVEQLGYNITQPGSTRDAKGQDWRQRVLAVTHYRWYLQNNVEQSLADIRQRAADLEHVESINVSQIHLDVAERLRELDDDIRRDAAEAMAILADCQQDRKRIDQEIERSRAHLARLRRITALGERLAQTLTDYFEAEASTSRGSGRDQEASNE